MKVYEGVNRLSFDSYESPCYIVLSGKKYIDLHSGAGAFFFGQKTSGTEFNPTNFFVNEYTNSLLGKLEQLTGYRCPILLCSGSEANEAAIKLSLKSNGKKKIGYVPGCYFGRTYLSVMCSENTEYNGFLPGKEFFVPVKTREDLTEDLSCLIMETYPSISLAWGENVFLMTKTASKMGINVICDDTKGAFRTGYLLSFRGHYVPDIVTLSKSLASGFPLSAVLVSNKMYSVCDDKWYTTTTGGHPTGAQFALDNLLQTGLENSYSFEDSFRKPLKEIFGPRLRIRGKYISISNINGRDFGKMCEDEGYYIYKRSKFVSFFPNNAFPFEMFREFLEMLKRKQVEQFFI